MTTYRIINIFYIYIYIYLSTYVRLCVSESGRYVCLRRNEERAAGTAAYIFDRHVAQLIDIYSSLSKTHALLNDTSELL